MDSVGLVGHDVGLLVLIIHALTRIQVNLQIDCCRMLVVILTTLLTTWQSAALAVAAGLSSNK